MAITAILTVGLLLVSYKVWYKLTTRRYKCDKKMDGKVVIVTGAETGIGKETARELARRGARVIMGCWDMKQGAISREEIEASTGNSSVSALPLDVGSLGSVRAFAAEVRRREPQLHVLVNNAAALALPRVSTKDGLLYEMQVNYFGPVLLTLLLVGLLRKSAPSRVVMVSSIEHLRGNLDVRDLNNPKQYVYANSKLANILFSNELARRLQGEGVTCNSLHPGICNTSIIRELNPICRKWGPTILSLGFKSVQDAAQTSVYLAVADEVANTTGKYFVECKEAHTSSKAQDKELARALWKETVRLVKVTQSEVDLDL